MRMFALLILSLALLATLSLHTALACANFDRSCAAMECGMSAGCDGSMTGCAPCCAANCAVAAAPSTAEGVPRIALHSGFALAMAAPLNSLLRSRDPPVPR